MIEVVVVLVIMMMIYDDLHFLSDFFKQSDYHLCKSTTVMHHGSDGNVCVTISFHCERVGSTKGSSEVRSVLFLARTTSDSGKASQSRGILMFVFKEQLSDILKTSFGDPDDPR